MSPGSKEIARFRTLRTWSVSYIDSNSWIKYWNSLSSSFVSWNTNVSKRRYKVSTRKSKYVSGIELAKAKHGTKNFEVIWCDFLHANSVDGALLGDHNANMPSCAPVGKRGSKVECPFLFTRLSMILMTLGPGSAASQILSLISVGNRLNNVNMGLSVGIFMRPCCSRLSKLCGTLWRKGLCVARWGMAGKAGNHGPVTKLCSLHEWGQDGVKKDGEINSQEPMCGPIVSYVGC